MNAPDTAAVKSRHAEQREQIEREGYYPQWLRRRQSKIRNSMFEVLWAKGMSRLDYDTLIRDFDSPALHEWLADALDEFEVDGHTIRIETEPHDGWGP